MATMDLKTYIDSEAEEEKELGFRPAPGVNDSAGEYPGDSAVYVDDSSVTVESVHLSGPDVDEDIYVARPGGMADVPLVLVIHENKGLVPYIENTARRLATSGYVAVAPDLLAKVGGTASFSSADATKKLGEISGEEIVEHLKDVITELIKLDYVNGDKVGILGFCYGGGITWRMLTSDDRLKVGVPFYGPIPAVADVPGIAAPVLGIYGETDKRITSMLPDIREAMEANGKKFEAIVYPGAGHAFHNDTNPDRYNADAAAQAWSAAVTFLDDAFKS